MREDVGCLICGRCWWNGCDKDADYEFDVVLKRHGRVAFDGKVELCAGHAQHAAKTNHVNVNWDTLEQALAKQAMERV